jgi:protein-S-isoprenylcysteine O-methyltransferase Ste14
MKKLIDAYLLAKPSTRGWLEWGILLASGIAGLIFGALQLPLSPYLNIAGGLLILGGFAFHVWVGRSHREAHKHSTEISRIVDRGMYAKIRHPLYLSVIAIDLGIVLAFGVVWTLALALIFSALAALTCVREERFLLARFPEQYGDYQAQVRWRLIPGFF